jgi:RNA polymerase sigma-70 factor (ECF subfamily)
MSKLKAVVMPVANIFDKALLLHRTRQTERVKSYLTMTDEELVAIVQKGEINAYSRIVERYQGKIYSYVFRLINHRDEAHDIVQDVFLKTYRHIHRVDTERKFSSWIYRIAHNESVNWLKKKTRVKIESLEHCADQGQQIASDSDVFSEFLQSEDKRMVREAIGSLPGKYAEVMRLRYLEHRSYEEIGLELEKPVNTVGTLINRAKKKMADLLAGSGYEK